MLLKRLWPRALSLAEPCVCPARTSGAACLSATSTPAARRPPCSLCACVQGKSSDARYCFTVSWYDVSASLNRQYQLIYYTADGTVEMVRGPSL